MSEIQNFSMDKNSRDGDYVSQEEEEKDGEFNNAMEATEKQLKVYPQRYIMAVLYSFMALSISLEQSMYGAEAASLQEIYGVSQFMINGNQIIHMLLHFPMSFPANYIVDKYGIRVGTLIAGFFILLGSYIRLLVNAGGNSFWISLVGATCIGIGNPFIINSLNKVSANWFYPSQRPQVTSFLSFFSTVTGLVGILLPAFWFAGYSCYSQSQANSYNEKHQDDTDFTPHHVCTDEERQHGKNLLEGLTTCLAIIVSCLVIPTLIFFRAKPPTPPSLVDDVQREDFGVALRVLARDKIYLLQALVFAIYYGSFQDVASFLALIIAPFGFTDAIFTGILCAIPIVSGVAGCIVTSKYLSKTQRYRKATILCMIGAIIGTFFFTALLFTGSFYALLLPAGFLGFFIIPLIPTVTEWACETSYPVGEPTVTGFIWAIAHIYAGTSGIGFTALTETGKKGYVLLMMSIIIILFFVAGFAGLFIKAPLKRLQAERDRALEKESGSGLITDSTEV